VRGFAPRLRVTALERYPAPAWRLAEPDWPAQAPVALRSWWTDQDLLRAGSLSKSGFKGDPFTLTNYSWRTESAGHDVTIDRVTYEPCKVEVKPGEFGAVEECVVVRLSYPKSSGPYFVQVPGWEPGDGQGEEHRFYLEAGKYTGVFWGRKKESVKGAEFVLFSVADFKKSALGKGQKLSLGTPGPDKDPPQPFAAAKW
jgi:hypothetical protein